MYRMSGLALYRLTFQRMKLLSPKGVPHFYQILKKQYVFVY